MAEVVEREEREWGRSSPHTTALLYSLGEQRTLEMGGLLRLNKDTVELRTFWEYAVSTIVSGPPLILVDTVSGCVEKYGKSWTEPVDGEGEVQISWIWEAMMLCMDI